MNNRKYKGILSVTSRVKTLSNDYSDYLQISYDIDNNTVISDYFNDMSHSSYKVYRDKNIINCGNIFVNTTMKEIKRMIDETLSLMEER